MKEKKMEEEVKKLQKQLKLEKEKAKYYKQLHYEETKRVNFNKFLQNNVVFLKENGVLYYLKTTIKFLFSTFIKIIKFVWNRVMRIKYDFNLRFILRKHKGKKIMVFYPGYDWNMKMYQRPQHMAVHYSKEDILFFYCTLNINEKVSGFQQTEKNLYVTNQFRLLKSKLPKYTLSLYANVNGCFLPELKQILRNGNDLIYEYIDDLHDDLTLISPELLERHDYVLKNEQYTVVATAKSLYDKVSRKRKKNYIYSTNGVLYDDFILDGKPEIPSKILDIVKEKKPIIGYYGALAKWFDFRLIEKLAAAKKDYNILLIGVDYDGTIKKYNNFKGYSNVKYIGPVDYKDLVEYGFYCDVLTVPFLVNDITLSTSPVKIFEYMAMRKPIVSTALPECLNYESVFISKTHDEFISNIEKALLQKNDFNYLNLLTKEAKENTWSAKANEIIEYHEKHKES